MILISWYFDPNVSGAVGPQLIKKWVLRKNKLTFAFGRLRGSLGAPLPWNAIFVMLVRRVLLIRVARR